MDSNTIEKLYRTYAKEVYLYSLSLCQNRDTAEDIVSEAFVRALLAMNADESSFKLWLLKVCKTIWIDMCRRSRYISKKSLDEITDTYGKDETLHNIIRQEQNQIVAMAILTLPDLCREAVTLFYFNNIPQVEIAELLGMTYAPARTLIYRGRKILFEKLKEVDYEFQGFD